MLRLGGMYPEFLLPNQLEKSAQLLGHVLCIQSHPLGCVGPGGIGWRPGGEQEKQEGGALQDQRSRRGTEGICFAYLNLGSLLGYQVGSPAL